MSSDKLWKDLGPARGGWRGAENADVAWICPDFEAASLLRDLGLDVLSHRKGSLPDVPPPIGVKCWVLVDHDWESYREAELWAARQRLQGSDVQVRDWSEYVDDRELVGKFSVGRLLESSDEEAARDVLYSLGARDTEWADAEARRDHHLVKARLRLETLYLEVLSDPVKAFAEPEIEAAATLKDADPAGFAQHLMKLKEAAQGAVNLNDYRRVVKLAVTERIRERAERVQAEAAEERREVRNFTLGWETSADGKTKPVYERIGIKDIVDQVHTLAKGWPKSVRGELFAPGPDYGDLGGDEPVRYLATSDDLSSWLQDTVGRQWRDGQLRDGEADVRGVTMGELRSSLVDAAPDRYDRVESMPHWPRSERIHYACRRPAGVDGMALAEFVELFNPDTELDRLLIQAMLVTPGWGGGWGRRPAFVVMSDHGRGVGKTMTIDAIARVWGGVIQTTKDEDWGALVKRLLTPSADRKRVILIDNLKGRLNSSMIESAITAPEISGHQMHVGNATIPNTFTWCISANTPELTTDLSDRAVPIKIGPRRHDVDFIEQIEMFLRDHRGHLVGDILDFLQREPAVELQSTTRFQAWERAILGQFVEGNELVSLIRDRRQSVDVEADDAAEVLQVIHRLLREGGFPRPEIAHTVIPTKILNEALKAHWLVKTLSSRSMWSNLKPLLVQPIFAGQAEQQNGGAYGRGLRWCGSDVTSGVPVAPWGADDHPY